VIEHRNKDGAWIAKTEYCYTSSFIEKATQLSKNE